MEESIIICSLTVRPDDAVVFSCPGKEYHSRLYAGRLAKQIIQRFDRLAKEHPEICRKEDLHLLGETLFDTMFGQNATQMLRADSGQYKSEELKESLGTVFLRLLDERKPAGAKVRLRLNLMFEAGADRWSNLPWEFLYAVRPDQTGFFIAGEGAIVSLTRIIHPPVERDEPHGPPHMLVVLAQPRELNFSLDDREFTSMLTDFQRRLDLQDRPESLFKATWDAVTQRLGDRSKPVPDIIHFIGHGQFAGGQSQIALHRSQQAIDAARATRSSDNPHYIPEEADWRNVEDLTAQLQSCAPRLFFLQTCNSGRAGTDFRAGADMGAFRGTAQQIAQAGVPFVVAMQYEIAAEDANWFTMAFYAALGAGESVDDAVMAGREVLGKLTPSYGHPRFGTPVVYLRCDGQVLIRPRPHGPPNAAPASTLWPQNCPRCANLLTDKRKRCKCDRWRLVYCKNGHVNVEGATECMVWDCEAPLTAAPSASTVEAPLIAASSASSVVMK